MYYYKLIEEGYLRGIICDRILKSLSFSKSTVNANNVFVREAVENNLLAIYDENNPIGFVIFKYNIQQTASVVMIALFEKYHNQGLGSILLNELFEYLKNKNINYLTAKILDGTYSDSINNRNKIFFVKNGFKILSHENNSFLIIKNII